MFGGRVAAESDRRLLPWAYDPPVPGVAGVDGARYLTLHHTASRIRFGAVFVLFVPGALLLICRLPPVRGRMAAAVLAV